MAADTVVVAVDTAVAVAAGRVALVAGATGLVGRAVLAGLLADKSYRAVHCVGRRALPLQHPKLVQHTVDFKAAAPFAALPHVDDVFIALGTTIKVAGSQAAFKAIDFEAIVAVAQAARAQGATKLGVVSAMGADPKSAIFYNRVKGEMEQALRDMGFKTLVIARPSMLAGDRGALKQPDRLGERLGLMAMHWLNPIIPNNYRSIQASAVANALVKAVKSGKPGVHVLLSGEMQ
jgi:uncharacterized protein YbjT (DUF2867 family)